MAASASTSKSIARAFISKSHHPHFNLSFEHHLLRSQPANLPVAFIYQNEPCIVIGRNQNPWHELDVSYMRKLGIKLVRRRSGGGAVYHDLGNANYSFHVAREQFTRRFHAELVARALNNDPINLKNSNDSDQGDSFRGAFVNERNDICVALKPNPSSSSDSPKLERKISGSAYKIITSRAYHHGTMLLSANLGDLGSALRPQRAAMESKGVASVPSSVINLIEAFPSRRSYLTHDGFCESVLGEFRRTYGENSSVENVDDQDLAEEVRKGWIEMDSWEWTFGQTPEFTHSISNLKGFTNPTVPPFQINLHVKNGRIIDAKLGLSSDSFDKDLDGIVKRLINARYDILADAPDTFGKPIERSAKKELNYQDNKASNRELDIFKHILPWFKTVL